MQKDLLIYGSFVKPEELYNQQKVAEKLQEVHRDRITAKSYLQSKGISANVIHALDAYEYFIQSPYRNKNLIIIH